MTDATDQDRQEAKRIVEDPMNACCETSMENAIASALAAARATAGGVRCWQQTATFLMNTAHPECLCNSCVNLCPRCRLRHSLEMIEPCPSPPREVPEAIEPDMWWDPEASEECLNEPWDAIENNQYVKAGDTFRLDCAKRLPSKVYTVIAHPTDPEDFSYRDATPEEVAEHEADEKAERARRKAEMDADNAWRKSRPRAERHPMTPAPTPIVQQAGVVAGGGMP